MDEYLQSHREAEKEKAQVSETTSAVGNSELLDANVGWAAGGDLQELDREEVAKILEDESG